MPLTQEQVLRRIAEDAQWFPEWCRRLPHDEQVSYTRSMARVIVRARRWEVA